MLAVGWVGIYLARGSGVIRSDTVNLLVPPIQRARYGVTRRYKTIRTLYNVRYLLILGIL